MEKGILTLIDNNGDEIQFYSETSADMVKHNHAGTETTVAALLNSLLAGDIDIESLKEKQDKSEILTGLSNLTLSENKIILATGENSFSTTALTSTGKSIISASTAKEIRKILGIYKTPLYDEVDANVWRFYGKQNISDGELVLDGDACGQSNATFSLNGSKPFTLECFANPVQNSALNYPEPILTLEPANSTSPIFFLRINGGSSGTNGAYEFSPFILADSSLPIGQIFDTVSSWGVKKHLAITFDGTTFKFFVDGNLIGSGDFNSFSDSYVLSISYHGINTVRRFQGNLDEIRLSNVCRYTENFTPETRFEVDEHTLSLLHFD